MSRLPGGRFGVWYVTVAGSVTTILSMVAAVIPTPDIENTLLFEVKIWGGLAFFAGTGYGLFRWFAPKGPTE